MEKFIETIKVRFTHLLIKEQLEKVIKDCRIREERHMDLTYNVKETHFQIDCILEGNK